MSVHIQSLHDAILNAADTGLRFAIAAGNSSADASGFEPADVEHDNVFTVSAIDSNDTFAWFSNFGNFDDGSPVDFAAPGVGIVSTKRGGGVTTLSGTSMAAPHVCGVLIVLGFPDNVTVSPRPNIAGFAIDDPDGIADPIASAN